MTNFVHIGLIVEELDEFEVVRFHSPSAGSGEPTPAANRPGLRHVAFNVELAERLNHIKAQRRN